MSIQTNSLLRRTLGLDAATCAAMGVALTVGSGPLAQLTGLPGGLLVGAGLVLLPIAGLMAWMARRLQVPSALVWLVIGGNAGWAAVSLLLLVSGWVEPTLAGQAFVIAQALGVVGLTALEYAGLRQGSRLAAA